MADETTTEMLAEIEGQATEYTPPEGWRVLAVGEKLQAGDMWVWPNSDEQRPTILVGAFVGSNQRYIRRIEPEPQPEPKPEKIITPDDVAAQQLVRGLVLQVAAAIAEQEATEQQQPKKTITPDDVAGAALAGVWDQGQAERTIEDLQHRLDVVSKEWAEQAATCNKLRAHVEAAEADLVQQRLERNRYQNQVLRLTAELDSMTTECRNLRIELDALQQAPQAETVAAVPTSKDDRFEEGWDAGTARAVETIAEWLEPIKAAIDAADNQDELARAGFFAIDTIRHMPAIMRTLTGLTPED